MQWKKVSRGARKRGSGEEVEDDDVGKELGNKRGSGNMQATEQSAVHDGGVSSESRSGMHRAPSVDDLFAPMFRLDVQSSENRLNNNAREGVTTATRGGGGGAGVVVGGGGGDGSGNSSGSVAVNKSSVPGFGVAALKEGSDQGGAIGTRHSAVPGSAASGGKHLVFVLSLSLSLCLPAGLVLWLCSVFCADSCWYAVFFQPNRPELTGCYYKLLQTRLYTEVRPS